MRASHGTLTVMAVVLLLTGACDGKRPPQPAAPGVPVGNNESESCAATRRVHAKSRPADTVRPGKIEVPEVAGVAPLRGVVVRAQPRARPAGGIAATPFLEPHFDRDVVVMVGSVEPSIDDLADGLVAQHKVMNTGTAQIDGQTVERTLTIKEGKEHATLTLIDCGEERWMITRAAIDPATTGECAKAKRVAACRRAMAIVDDLSSAVSADGRSLIRPELDERGRVVVDVRYALIDGARSSLPVLLHSSMTDRGWRRIDAPPCPGPVDLGDLCHIPEDDKSLRQGGGISYKRGGESGRWKSTWRLTRNGSALTLRLLQLP